MLTYYIAAFRNGQQEFWDNSDTHSLWEPLLEKKKQILLAGLQNIA